MRQALNVATAAGVSVMIGVTPSGTEISTRPFQLVTDWVWKGSAFGGARGRTDPPKIVDIDDLITLTTPLDKISDAFELLRRGKLIHSVVLC